jgi:hypothetical protein
MIVPFKVRPFYGTIHRIRARLYSGPHCTAQLQLGKKQRGTNLVARRLQSHWLLVTTREFRLPPWVRFEINFLQNMFRIHEISFLVLCTTLTGITRLNKIHEVRSNAICFEDTSLCEERSICKRNFDSISCVAGFGNTKSFFETSSDQLVSFYPHNSFLSLNLHLRGGVDPNPGKVDVMPTAGPPSTDGKLRTCAQCGAVETRVSLGHCKITELYFCAKTECRKQHWRANANFWRERATQVNFLSLHFLFIYLEWKSMSIRASISFKCPFLIVLLHPPLSWTNVSLTSSA